MTLQPATSMKMTVMVDAGNPPGSMDVFLPSRPYQPAALSSLHGDIQRSQDEGYRSAAQQVLDTLDPAVLAARDAAQKAHAEATAALEAARRALAAHGDKPPKWKLGGNDAWYSKRTELARRVEHLVFDVDATAEALTEHQKIVSTLALA